MTKTVICLAVASASGIFLFLLRLPCVTILTFNNKQAANTFLKINTYKTIREL